MVNNFFAFYINNICFFMKNDLLLDFTEVR